MVTPTFPVTRTGPLTLPDAAEAVGVRVDRLRKLLARQPAVRGLFSRTGPLWTIDPARLDDLRAAVTAAK